jgi:flagella basal body P-ring formation protein FlgA
VTTRLVRLAARSALPLLELAIGAALVLAGTALGAQSPRARTASAAYVAARALPRGHVLAADDMSASAPASAAAPATAPAVPSAPVGWTTRRVIAAGEPLRAPAIAPPAAIRGGQPVDVVYADGMITLRLKGTAMNAAALGERVTVRLDARRRVEGVAAAPGTVQLR